MTKLMFAVPTHNMTLQVETVVTLLECRETLRNNGIDMQVLFKAGSIITHVRNAIVADFLASECTHLFMLDSDQGLPPSLVLRMIGLDKPIVGTFTPRRNFFWPTSPIASAGLDAQALIYHGMRFVGDAVESESGQVDVREGFVQAQLIGTGAILLRRDAFERLAAAYPGLKSQGFPDGADLGPAEHNWGFFNTMVQAVDGLNAGEDIGFCHRWTRAGGELWADVSAVQQHVGRHVFTGSYLQQMQALGGLTLAQEGQG